MKQVVISGLGVYHPTEKISNQELVESFNTYVRTFNQQNAEQIARGEIEALRESSVEFIEKASGIKSRYVIDKKGILDPSMMRPIVTRKSENELSVQAEMAVAAAKEALKKAGRVPHEVDMIIVASSNFQRAYPAIAIEVQHALGTSGFAYDMNVACSSATFAIHAATAAIRTDQARCALLINPEICSAHLDFRDRDSHFIFGDACAAAVVEDAQYAKAEIQFEIIDTALKTQFSNNIRNNFGFLTKSEIKIMKNPGEIYSHDQYFMQEGRKVFKDVTPLVSHIIEEHLTKNNLSANQIKRFWLHQANINMNRLIIEKLLGEMIEFLKAPNVLDEFANTSSPGCMIAMTRYHEDFKSGEYGVICSFGAGYSVGNIIVRRL